MNKFEKPLHIIIDGPDGVGKTTICSLLSRKLDIPVIKMPKMVEYIEDKIEEKMSKLWNDALVQFSEFNWITDRGYPSSYVYSKIYGRNVDLSYLEIIKQKLQPRVFILVDDFVAIVNRKREDEIIENNERELTTLDYSHFAKYDKFVNEIKVNGRSPIQICNQIISQLEADYLV